jgi:hypothetical protein
MIIGHHHNGDRYRKNREGTTRHDYEYRFSDALQRMWIGDPHYIDLYALTLETATRSKTHLPTPYKVLCRAPDYGRKV